MSIKTEEPKKRDPLIPERLLAEGLALHQAGELEKAEYYYQRVLEVDDKNADALHLLGLASYQTNRLDSAIEYLNSAISVNPKIGAFHKSLGNLHKDLGRLDDAEKSYQQAISLQANDAETLNNLGMILRKKGKLVEAIGAYKTAIRSAPGIPQLYNNLGNVLKDNGDTEDALKAFSEAIRLVDSHSVSQENPGPMSEIFANLGGLYLRLGKLKDAEDLFNRSLKINPDSALPLKSLGDIASERSDVDGALNFYQQSLSVSNDHGLIIKSATILPAIYNSSDHLYQSRQRVYTEISKLETIELNLVDPLREVGRTNFLMAYQGLNDVQIQTRLARLYSKACPELNYISPQCRSQARPGEKIKLGFISSFFIGDHIIAKMYGPVIESLDRKIFDVTVFHTGELSRGMHRALRPGDKIEKLPLVLSMAREIVSHKSLDILLYTDIGMDPFTYFLAFSRLARYQCVAGGHPVTTGIDSIDYFISSTYDEIEDPGSHYSEQVVLLDCRPVYYPRPKIPKRMKGRDSFGLPANKNIYLCAMTPYKYHPEFDHLLKEILELDENGVVVFVTHPAFTELFDLLRQRLERSLGSRSNSLLFIPRQNSQDFLNLMHVSDVFLDTIHFGAGSTSFEAFAVGVPVVTLPGEFLRARGPQSAYRKMEYMDLATTTNREFVETAVRVGTDKDLQNQIRQEILARNSVLYENREFIHSLQNFFLKLIEGEQNSN
jgi:protein O-GlcNAc transferase